MISPEQESIIKDTLKRYSPSMVGIFGSYARNEQRESSDLDILVDPTPMTSLFDIGAIRRELKQLLGVKVDVLTPNALPDSFRSQVLSLAQPI